MLPVLILIYRDFSHNKGTQKWNMIPPPQKKEEKKNDYFN